MAKIFHDVVNPSPSVSLCHGKVKVRFGLAKKVKAFLTAGELADTRRQATAVGTGEFSEDF